MEISKEFLEILLILLPGLISFIIIESLIPHKKVEFNRLVIYVVLLSALSFILSIIIWKICSLCLMWFGFESLSKLNETASIFSYQSNFTFIILVFIISIIIGSFLVWAINEKVIYKIMNKINASHMLSNLEVWDDFFAMPRENAFVVIRDIEKNLMYYGIVAYYSISTTSKTAAIYLKDVDVFKNDTAEKLYDVKEIYLPFRENVMTVEFPNFSKEVK